MPKKKRDLPKYCYARRNRIWIRYKDESGEWVSEKTRYTLDQADEAGKFVRRVLRGIEARRDANPEELGSALTVAVFARRWCDDRDKRKVGSAASDRARLEKYVLPRIGKLHLAAVRPRDVRDVVRALRALDGDEKIAPRTIINIAGIMHTMFRDAEVDELIDNNPVKLKSGEMPKKVDADPEWRSRATFTVREVERLISDPLIPVERRVLYALKAIAGLRHGEAAALCWRHIDATAEPLHRLNVVQAYSTTERAVKSTKTEETRAVPVHPTLAKILAAWKLEHWERIYGRKPKDDDYVVPTRTLNPVDGKDACEAMKRDLRALGMRVEAGENRDRGGHDLRSWYQTRMIEDDADSLIIRRTTHAASKDVNSGYERFSWATICREVAKLKVEVLDGKVLELATRSLHAEKKAGARWTSVVTPKGLEGGDSSASEQVRADSSSEKRGDVISRALSRTPLVAALATRLENAIRRGDLPRALELVGELREAGADPRESEGGRLKLVAD